MPYQPYDLASKESKEFKAKIHDKSNKLDQIASRTTHDSPRPLNHIEQNAVHCIYAIGEFVDAARDALGRRGKAIPRFNARLGLMQYAARSIFQDVIGTLDRDSAARFARNSQNMRIKCAPKDVGLAPQHARVFWDDDLAEIHEAAWRGTCEFCGLTGAEARECKLRKAFDHTMMLDASDNPDCWWRAD